MIILRRFGLYETLIAIPAVFALCILARILFDTWTDDGFVSFTGKTEIAVVEMSATEPQYEWSLSGAYICFDSDAPPASISPLKPDGSKDQLCAGPHGTALRKYASLPDDVSLAVVGETTLEIAVASAPYHADDALYPSGRAPKSILVIRSSAPLDSQECSRTKESIPVLAAAGFNTELWEGAEIHVPVTENTLMPYAGKIRVGQSASSNTADQLKEGTLAVFRKVRWLFDFMGIRFGNQGPSEVKEQGLFPGDVLKFEKQDECLASTSGFLRAQNDDQGDYIQVVASMRSAEGRALVERARPGSSSNSDDIAVQLQWSDAILTHPLTVWLGLFVSIFLLSRDLLGWARKSSR